MSAPAPSWYDLLGVEPDATADEIRAAWKSAIADLDPSDRRFRTMNQAAEVLLDPATRATYDASLATEEGPVPQSGPPGHVKGTSGGSAEPATADAERRRPHSGAEISARTLFGNTPVEIGWVVQVIGGLAFLVGAGLLAAGTESAGVFVAYGVLAALGAITVAIGQRMRRSPADSHPGTQSAKVSAAPTGGDSSHPGSAQPAARAIPAWLLAGLGILAAVLVGLCIWQAGEPTDEQVKEATTDAQAAAERAIVAIVSYDYRSLEDDQTKASAYMTDDFKKDYEALFAVIRENAPETKTVLTTEVVASGVVRSGDDRVQIFMFIDNPRTNAEITTPEVQRNQVTVTMEQVGDEWLVDDLKTTLPAS